MSTRHGYDIHEVSKGVSEMAAEYGPALRKELLTYADLGRPTEAEMRNVVMMMLAKYPAEEWQRPDGAVVMISPWEEMMMRGLVEDGREWWEKAANAFAEPPPRTHVQVGDRFRGIG